MPAFATGNNGLHRRALAVHRRARHAYKDRLEGLGIHVIHAGDEGVARQRLPLRSADAGIVQRRHPLSITGPAATRRGATALSGTDTATITPRQTDLCHALNTSSRHG